MRQILEIEEYVQIPPQMYSDPFYRITYLIKEEIRKYKWIEGEKGHKLSWEQALSATAEDKEVKASDPAGKMEHSAPDDENKTNAENRGPAEAAQERAN